MNLKEIKEQYGTGKLLNNLRESDFSSYNDLEETCYKNIQIRIERDFGNNHWIYSSDEISFSGRFCGSLNELKSMIKSHINSLNC